MVLNGPRTESHAPKIPLCRCDPQEVHFSSAIRLLRAPLARALAGHWWLASRFLRGNPLDDGMQNDVAKRTLTSGTGESKIALTSSYSRALLFTVQELCVQNTAMTLNLVATKLRATINLWPKNIVQWKKTCTRSQTKLFSKLTIIVWKKRIYENWTFMRVQITPPLLSIRTVLRYYLYVM